jgi:hypothetical protein
MPPRLTFVIPNTFHDIEVAVRAALVHQLCAFFDPTHPVVWDWRLEACLRILLKELTGDTRTPHSYMYKLYGSDLRKLASASRREASACVLASIGLEPRNADIFLTTAGWAKVQRAVDAFCAAAEDCTTQKAPGEWRVEDVATKLLGLFERSDFHVYLDVLALGAMLDTLRTAKADPVSDACEGLACSPLPLAEIRLIRAVDAKRLPAVILRKLRLTDSTAPALLGQAAWDAIRLRFDQAGSNA